MNYDILNYTYQKCRLLVMCESHPDNRLKFYKFPDQVESRKDQGYLVLRIIS